MTEHPCTHATIICPHNTVVNCIVFPTIRVYQESLYNSLTLTVQTFFLTNDFTKNFKHTLCRNSAMVYAKYKVFQQHTAVLQHLKVEKTNKSNNTATVDSTEAY